MRGEETHVGPVPAARVGRAARAALQNYWQGLDVRLVNELPDDLRAHWPRFIVPTDVSDPKNPPRDDDQRIYIGGLAALFASAHMKIHVRISGQVKLIVAAAVHADITALLMRIVQRGELLAQVTPSKHLVATLRRLVPVKGAHLITAGVRPVWCAGHEAAAPRCWRDDPIVVSTRPCDRTVMMRMYECVSPGEPGEYLAELSTNEIAARIFAGLIQREIVRVEQFGVAGERP